MALFQPQELLAFLNGLHRGADRSLSQNFLIDGNIVRNIVSLVAPASGDAIVEIGPGPGVLTEQFLGSSCAAVIAIERDAQFAEALPRLSQPGGPELEVICADALQVDFLARFQPLAASSSLKLVSNIPYHLTTPLLEKILASSSLFSSITVMVQEEVAQKIVDRDRRCPLSLLHECCAESVSYELSVSKSCFLPSPKVHSAVLQIIPRRSPLVSEDRRSHIFEIIRQAFSMKRKTVQNSLRSYEKRKGQIEEALASIGASALSRPEELSFSEWVQLFAYIY